MSYNKPLHLFDAFGVELEYMIVDARTLQVKPITDKVIFDQVGAYVSDVELGEMAWSNELVLHVIELKTNGPAADLTRLTGLFQEQVTRINGLLQPYGACLMPTGMHPQMDPEKETQLWPHEYNQVYHAYNRIFDCRGHGWSNLQSTHLNLPFADDAEFGRLHAAIRLLLPILPALSASSPVMVGELTGFADNRLEVYRTNQSRIPAIAGSVIPEAVFTQKDYEEKIFGKIYRAIAPHDPDNILQDEFLNSRGAIARFSRGAIEIRVLDIQECPLADLAILQVVVAVLQQLVAGTWSGFRQQQGWHEEELAEIFLEVIRDGSQTQIRNRPYLFALGIDTHLPVRADKLWQHLWDKVQTTRQFPEEVHRVMEVILREGNLAERITRALGDGVTPEKIREVYGRLTECLASGKIFSAEGTAA